jgi:hypothetical protein
MLAGAMGPRGAIVAALVVVAWGKTDEEESLVQEILLIPHAKEL